MRKFIDSFLIVFLTLFTIPSIFIVASWDSYPGSRLFAVKLGLEKALAFVVAPSYDISVALQMKYTERRFSEAKKLLADQHSVSGLVYLTNQVQETKQSIIKAPETKSQAEATVTYIQELADVSAALEQQKRIVLAQTVAPATINIFTPTPTPTPTPTQMSTPHVAQVTSAPAPPDVLPVTPVEPTPTPTPIALVATTDPVPTANAIVALQITQTQQRIEETIRELEEHKEKRKRTPGIRGKRYKSEKIEKEIEEPDK